MFQQLKMTGTETEVVFNKMNEQLSNAVVMDVAPLFHQLLKLFRHNSSCSGKLFASITQYFGSRQGNIFFPYPPSLNLRGGGLTKREENLGSSRQPERIL